jgi:cyclophilin family peptidyl-prolyl cis-trans isomerase
MEKLKFTGIFLASCLFGVAVSGDLQEASPDAYNTSLREWKDQLQELRDLRDQLRDAEGEKELSLRRQYAAVVEKGKESLRKFSAAAEAELSRKGRHQTDAAAFLRVRLQYLIDHDDFEAALRISRDLIKHGTQTADVYEVAAVAAYMTNQADLVGKYLQQAEAKGTISADSKQLLESAPELEKAWKEEQQIRQSEAAADDLPRVRLATSKGDIVVELFENEAPLTVNNFVHLVDQGFYDGLSFHRVLPGFVVQGGCPVGDGTGGPGYMIPCECYGDNYRRHFRGSLSMAKKSEPHTGGSQFFFTLTPASDLDGRHTVFGRIIEGMEVLAKLQRRDPENLAAPPADRILSAKVERRRDHQYRPTKTK